MRSGVSSARRARMMGGTKGMLSGSAPDHTARRGKLDSTCPLRPSGEDGSDLTRASISATDGMAGSAKANLPGCVVMVSPWVSALVEIKGNWEKAREFTPRLGKHIVVVQPLRRCDFSQNSGIIANIMEM